MAGTRDYNFNPGWSTGATPDPVDPTVSTDLVKKGFADKSYARGITTIAALKAIGSTDRTDNLPVFVDELQTWFYFDSGSSATGDDVNVIAPTSGSGRWIRFIRYDLLSPNTTKGDITVRAASANSRLAVGANGQVLTADSTQTAGVKWADPAANPTTTKGDLAGYSTAPARIPVGTNGQVLTADSTAALGVAWKNPTAPTIQKFTSGSGTYTPPAGVRWIRVRMVGGGGGGGCSGSALGSAATAGSHTTFGPNMAGAGGPGSWAASSTAGGSGGGLAFSLGVGFASYGTCGGGIVPYGMTTSYGAGGFGSPSHFGGGGGQAYGAGTLGGGGSGGGSSATSVTLGTGGGSGGYIDCIITNPATYSYSVGAAGAGGGAGTNGQAGQPGGAGIIIVEEFYT